MPPARFAGLRRIATLLAILAPVLLLALAGRSTPSPPVRGGPPPPVARSAARVLASATIAETMGVNIHFWGAPQRDLDLIQEAGFRLVRMDFTWAGTERVRGQYYFTPYDEMVDGLARRGMRALFILGYANPVYDRERCVRTAEARQAFARWAAVAARRYRGRPVIWEIWNEPNTGFWKSREGTREYLELVRATATAIRQADGNATIVGPASSGVSLDFLEDCFRQGLLRHVDALTVHPYRSGARPPETVEAEISALRALVGRYSTARPAPPVLSGEWGYTTARSGVDEAMQARYLERMFLTNASLGIPLSVWYDWRDDGTDPANPEHHFGLVTRDWKPKPAWRAARRLTQALAGMAFIRRLPSAPEHRLLLFGSPRARVVAAYTMAPGPSTALVGGRRVQLTGTPQYIPYPSTLAP